MNNNSLKAMEVSGPELPHLPEKLASLANTIDSPKELVNHLLGD